MNLNQITLPTSSITDSRAFYLKLGFELIVDTPHYLRFACENQGTTFSFIKSESDTREQEHQNDTVIYFETEDLDERVRRLEQQGIVFTQKPKDMPYLWREAELTDPARNKIKLYWAGANRLNPPWRVGRSEY